MAVRELLPTELHEAEAILDQALLEFDRDRLLNPDSPGIRLGYILDDRLAGVAFVDECHIIAIAVRPRDRNQGIGRRLIDTISERCETVTATCEPRNREFYAALGFTLEATGDGTLRATLH